MTNIDSSLRRPILPQHIGGQVQDSKPLLAENPQLVMTPGVSRPVYRFDDGNGLTDAFGNVYDGYGGNSRRFQISPAESIDDEIDESEDKDIIQYNIDRLKYEPKSLDEAGIALFDTTEPELGDIPQYDDQGLKYVPKSLDELELARFDNVTPVDGDIPQYNASLSLYEPKNLGELGLAKFGGSSPTEGQIAYWNNTTQQYEPADPPVGGGGPGGSFVLPDFISGIIEIPKVRIYRLIISLPYEITITSTSYNFATGSGFVILPSGVRAQGTPLDINIFSLNASAEFLRFQINYTRVVNP